MIRRLWLLGLLLVACGQADAPAPAPPAAPTPAPEPAPEPPAPEPPAAEPPLIALDTHVDTTQRMLDLPADIAERSELGHLDLPRMREGGLTGAFFSIWVDPREYEGDAAWDRARALIGAVEELARAHPHEAVICRTGDDVRAAATAGKIALLMGIEGAHALGAPADDAVLFERLEEAWSRGVRYMTITWSNDNRFAHSSGGRAPARGLTDLGRELIRWMNRTGMIVDISHVSDRTFWDIVEVAERPLLASHSSARALSDHPRNMTDAMIRAVGEGGGAVCINYYTEFIDHDYAVRRDAIEEANRDRFREVRAAHGRWDHGEPLNALARELGGADLAVPTLETLGAHFAHVAELAGPEAVCLGSDFDGVGELPIGLEDVSHLGALRAELERRELPVRPIFGGNVLRVLDAQRGL
ncbi:MAG: dipeptidase [Sandaracinaceae bacterium]|nr:dipeptidase [Sandaracinaceae bacterium]